MSGLKVNKQGKQVLLLYVATLVGALLGFATSIVNTRFLGKEGYGDVRYVQNMIQLVSWVLLFGYFMSGSRLLSLTENEAEKRRIRGSMVMILVICMAVLALLTFVIGLFHLNSSAVSGLFMVAIPVSMYPLLINYVNTTAQGDNFIGRLSLARVLPALLYVPVAYLVFKRFGATSSSMMILQWGLYSLVIAAIIISTRPGFSDLKPVFASLNSENRAYGIKLYLGSLAMVATSYIGGVTLGIFNDDNVNVGFYTLAITLTTPLSYLPGIVGTAYFRKFVHEDRIPRKVMIATIAITLASCVLFILVIGPVVRLFYSDEYQPVGKYAVWLSIGFCIHGMGDMLNRFMGSHGEGTSIRNASFVSGAVKLLGFIFLVWIWDIDGAVLTNILSSTTYCIIMYVYYRKVTSDQTVGKD